MDRKTAMQKTRQLLKSYKQIQAAIADKLDRAQSLRADAQRVNVGGIDYGRTRVTGSCTASTVEREAVRHERMIAQAERLEGEAAELGRLKRSIDRALEVLPDELRQVLRLYYVDGLTCYAVAMRLYVADATVRKRAERALGRIAAIVTGDATLLTA